MGGAAWRVLQERKKGLFKSRGGRERGEVVGSCCHGEAPTFLGDRRTDRLLHLHRVPELALGTASSCVILVLMATVFIIFAGAFSQLPRDFSVIVPPTRSEPPAGFKYLRGRNQDGYFIYNFLQC